MQCLPLTEGGTKSAGEQGHWVLLPPRQQHTLRFAEGAKDVCSCWPFSVGRVPAGWGKVVRMRARTHKHTHASKQQTHKYACRQVTGIDTYMIQQKNWLLRNKRLYQCTQIMQLTSFLLYLKRVHTPCTGSSTLTDQQSTMTEYTSLGQPGGGGRQ